MKILIAEWKAWTRWREHKWINKMGEIAQEIIKSGRATHYPPIDRTAQGEVELLPEEYMSYTEYREYMKSKGTKKRVYRRKKDESK